MTDLTTPKSTDTPRRRLSMSFKVANKVLLDNISDDDDSDDDSNKNLNGKTLVSVERQPQQLQQQPQQQQQKKDQKLTDEQLSELYKREIKLCTDKKITLENAWQFSLLDNMNVANSIFTPKHRKDKQVSFQSPQKSPRKSNIHLRFSETPEQDDAETNFQMASTVIEAGATVYSMRVQSLYTETDKMRDKLAASNKKLASRDNDDTDSEAERIFAGADDEDRSVKKARRRAAASTLTTEDKICARDIDTNLEPDPLFNKDTEIYMLGGCQRLLLGRADTLAGRTILLEPTRDDAVDLCAFNRKSAAVKVEEEKEKEKKGGNDSDDDDDNSAGNSIKDEPFVEADMPIERGCLTSLVPVAVSTIELCPMIREYSWDAVFGPSKVPDIEISDNIDSLLGEDPSDDSLPMSSLPLPPPPASTENESKDELFEGVAPADDDNDRDDDIGFMGAIDVDDDMTGNSNNDNISSTPPIVTDLTNDASKSGKSLINDENSNASPSKNDDASNAANGTNEDYFFFDPKLMLNWAGPDHWKFPTLQKTEARRPSDYDADGEPNGDGAEQQPPPKKRGRKKEGTTDGCFIDFTSQAKFDPKLFEPPAKTSTTLSDAALKKHTALATTLPPDIHYDVSMLSRLFLNPSWQFSERRTPAQSTEARQDANGDLERVASQEWYEYNSQPLGPDDDDGFGGVGGAGGDDDDDNEGFGMPSSFGDDSLGSLGSLGSVVGGSQAPILTTLIAAPPQLKIGHVNFTKEMRVVDVGLIKRTLWKHLSEPSEKKEEEEEEKEEEKEKEKEESGEVTKSFKEILTEISNDLPNDTMEDLTVSFCFMCVLHLCNEKSMHITMDKDTNDLIIHRPKDN